MNIENIELILKKLIKKAQKQNEVPIAAIVTYKNKIISKAYNKVNKKNNIMCHAEIIALNKAAKKLKNWRLSNCEMYVTLEPCSMCKEIIKKYRIKNVYFFTYQNSQKTESEVSFKHINKNNIFSEELKNFFKFKRQK